MLDDLKPIMFSVPNDGDIVIHPISDLHYGSAQFDEKAFTAYLDKYGNKEKHYFAILGDCINNATKSSVSNVYEELCSPRQQKEWLVETLKPIKDKIILGVGGNHERRSVKEVDDNPLYDVFSKLDIEDKYRENIAFVICNFLDAAGRGNNSICGAKRPAYTICATHGAGNGMYIGSSANKAERFGMAIDGLDLLLLGHTHKPVTFPARKLKIVPHNKQVIFAQFKVVVASSWLNYGGYPTQKLLPPTAVEQSHIILSAHGKNITVVQ